MKINYHYFLLCILSGLFSMPASAVIADEPTPKVVFEEDFSLVPAITPWDKKYYKIFGNDDTNNLHPEFFHAEGWKGMNIGYGEEAGVLYISGEDDVYLQTPALELSANGGKVTIVFEYKRGSWDNQLTTTDHVYVQLRDRANGMDQGITGIYSNGVEINTEWGEYSVTLEGGTADCSIRFWPGSYFAFIRSVKVLQVRPELDSPVADAFTDYTGDSFTANWRAVEGADHYLLNVFTLDNDVREYALKDVEVKDTKYAVTGLDPKKTYNYTVKAVNSQYTSEESNVIRCFGITRPEINDFADIDEKGFTVSWDEADNANLYQLEVYLDHTAPVDQKYYILDEDFLSTPEQDADPDKPVRYGEATIWLDDYMNRSNWLVKQPGFAGDCLTLDNTLASMGRYGEIDGPTMDLSANGGKVTVEMRVRALNAASMGLYMLTEVPKVNQFTSDKIVDKIELWDENIDNKPLSDKWEDRTFTLNGGTDKSYIVIQAYGYGAMVQIDRLAVYQELKKGETIRVPYRSVITDSTVVNISTNGEGFNKDNDSFICKVRGAYTGEEADDVVYSEWSDEKAVALPTSENDPTTPPTENPGDDPDADGIEDVTAGAADITVKVEAGCIVVENPSESEITIYTIAGAAVMSSSAQHFTTPALPAGIYFAGGHKVLVK